jgi:hypothetical protein
VYGSDEITDDGSLAILVEGYLSPVELGGDPEELIDVAVLTNSARFVPVRLDESENRKGIRESPAPESMRPGRLPTKFLST